MYLINNFALLFPMIVISLSIQSKSADSARILGIFPIPCKSHHFINQPIVKGLAVKGHEVTIISYFKSNDNTPNYTEIVLPEPDISIVDSVTIENSIDLTGLRSYLEVNTVHGEFCSPLHSDYIKRLINSNENPIDLIIVEAHHTLCYHLIAYKLKVPLILVSPSIIAVGIDYYVGNPLNPSFIPLFEFTMNMNFFQRVKNSISFAVLYWYHNYVFNNRNMEVYAREIFNMSLPLNEELNKISALAFYNNHFSFLSRPKSPNAIDIAGIHIKEPMELPKDIKDFIEGSTHGVIFFSLGTIIKGSSISPEKLKIIKNAFSVIPQRILWRLDESNMTDVPPNVKIGKWFPQRDVLGHKNVIAFISHCGFLGITEAIHTATPIIGMPFIFDQITNAQILVEQGVGIQVDYFSMDDNTFIDAINEVVKNTKYKENMKRLSKIFKDRPMSPLDEALYWTEYVLKHQGAPHLRTAAADMPLHEYLLLDVLTLILVIVVGFLYFLKRLFGCIISLVCSRRKPKKDRIQ